MWESITWSRRTPSAAPTLSACCCRCGTQRGRTHGSRIYIAAWACRTRHRARPRLSRSRCRDPRPDFAVRARLGDPRDLPYFHCCAVSTCHREYAWPWQGVRLRLTFWVYPGFPTIFSGLLGFFVGDFMGKALWQLVENAQRFPRRGGRVLCVHGAVSFHGARPWATRWLPGRGARRDVELDRCVLGLRSGRCSHQNRRPVQAERSIYPGKTEISGTYALWETRI